MKAILYLIAISLFAIFSGCDNTREIEDSKKDGTDETKLLEELKHSYTDSLSKLKVDVNRITDKKRELVSSNKFSEVRIYNTLKDSYLDHVIIGSKDLKETARFFSEILGFTLKRGTEHSNGISNSFIEFENGSEIEIIEVKDPKDSLSEHYNKQIQKGGYGLNFAVRVENIDTLYRHFKDLNSKYSEMTSKKDFTVLSANNSEPNLPLFFIQHNRKLFNTKIQHENGSLGIHSVWIGTNNLEQDIMELIDYGFEVHDTARINYLNKKTFLMKNNNFAISIFESRNNNIQGVSIQCENLDTFKKRLVKQNVSFIETIVNGKVSIVLEPEVTHSIYLEFAPYYL